MGFGNEGSSNAKRRIFACGLLGLVVLVAGVGFAIYVRAAFSVAVVDASSTTGPRIQTPVTTQPGPTDWPQWRGSNGTGIATTGTPPRSWSRRENIAWEAPLVGNGHSSPVVWGDSVFLTTADEAAGTQSVVCVDFADGRVRWIFPALHGKLPLRHEKNTHASATPACDGEMVYCVFAVDDSIQVVALTFAGRLAWRTNAGPFFSQHGYGSSPALFGSLLIINAESRGSKLGRIRASSFMAALDCKTGELVWRIRRPEEHGYATPVVGRIAGRDQLIVSGFKGINSYDPATGKPIWNCRCDTERFTSTAAYDSDHVFVSGTYHKNEILCIRADGEGDVTDTHVTWKAQRGASDIPSPLVLDGRLYVLQDKGVLNCYNAVSGKPTLQKRLGGNFTASPIIAGGCLYAANEAGTTFVLTLDPNLQVVETNELDDPIFATPTPCGSSILIRTAQALRKISHEH